MLDKIPVEFWTSKKKVDIIIKFLKVMIINYQHVY